MATFQRSLRRYQSLLTFLSLLVASLAALVWILIPATRSTYALFTKLLPLESDIKNQSQKLRFLEGLDEEILSGQLVVLSAAIPRSKSFPTLLVTVEGIAGQSGATLGEMTVETSGSLATASGVHQTPEEKKIGSSLIPFGVNIEGTFDQIKSFMTIADGVRRFVRIRNFDFVLPEGGDKLKARIGLDVFYSPITVLGTGGSGPALSLSPDEEAFISKLSTFPWLSQRVSDEVTATAPPLNGKSNPFIP